MCCRPAGMISIPGVYSGLVDKIPMGQAMNKGLTFRMGQTHVNRWTDDLLRRIEEGEIDPSFVITHTVGLEDGPEMYKVFRDKQDSCIKVVMKPGQEVTFNDLPVEHRPLTGRPEGHQFRPEFAGHCRSPRPSTRLVQHRPRPHGVDCAAPDHEGPGHGGSGTLGPRLRRARDRKRHTSPCPSTSRWACGVALPATGSTSRR